MQGFQIRTSFSKPGFRVWFGQGQTRVSGSVSGFGFLQTRMRKQTTAQRKTLQKIHL